MALTITWIGQSGFILENGIGALAVDPFCGTPQQGMKRNYEPDPQLKNRHVDMVVCTHHHWDHFDPYTYQHYIIPKTLIAPSPCIDLAQNDPSLSAIEKVVFNCGQVYESKGFKITAVLAEHDNDTIGVIVESDGHSLYFSGDTMFSSNLLMRNWGMMPDIMCICINGKFGNMHYVEAAMYCNFFHAKFAIPAHHDMMLHNTEDPNCFVEALKTFSPETTGLILERCKTYNVKDLMRQNSAY